MRWQRLACLATLPIVTSCSDATEKPALESAQTCVIRFHNAQLPTLLQRLTQSNSKQTVGVTISFDAEMRPTDAGSVEHLLAKWHAGRGTFIGANNGLWTVHVEQPSEILLSNNAIDGALRDACATAFASNTKITNWRYVLPEARFDDGQFHSPPVP